jgi:hypothetical protein
MNHHTKEVEPCFFLTVTVISKETTLSMVLERAVIDAPRNNLPLYHSLFFTVQDVLLFEFCKTRTSY